MKTKVICVILFFGTLSFSGQTSVILKGKVTDSKANALPNATVVVFKPNTNKILSYTNSDINGFFTIKGNYNFDSLSVKASYIGFESKKKRILNKSKRIDFELLESLEELKEVVVKNNIIDKKGDTISYSVARFKNQKDVVIADVLKKMPGIEVQLDGTILYQGKPIEKYYIEGLDLLEGKYNLANNNLPAGEVSKVQILENHQPIRILDSVISSDNTSLNIKLKKKSVFVIPVSTGLGYKPKLYEASGVPMLFRKNNQFIGSYKSNNSGNNVARELKVLTFDEFYEEKKMNEMSWLNISPLSTPIMNDNRWLNNRIHLITLNTLKKLKNNFQLKIGTSYIDDIQYFNGSSVTTFFIDNNKIDVVEEKNNTQNISELLTKITLEKNNKKIYFKNSFEFNSNWNGDFGAINNNEIQQDLLNPHKQINNSLKWIFPFKKNLIHFNSRIYFDSSDKILLVKPGFYEDLFNNGNPYEKLKQFLKHDNFFTNNSFGFTKSVGRFTVSPKIGIEFQKQFLESNINIDNNKPLDDNRFLNDITFKKSSLFTSTLVQFQKNLFKIDLILPMRTLNIQSFNASSDVKIKLDKIIFEPSFKISRELGSFWKIAVSSYIKNNFGNINEVFDGFILTDYRNISSYKTLIREDKIQSHNIRISYKDLVKGIFVSAYYLNKKNTSNILFDYQYNNDGLLTINAFEKSNTVYNESVAIRTSKFLNKLNTTINLDLRYTLQNRNRVINEELIQLKNQQFSTTLKVDYELGSWLNIILSKSILNTKAISVFQNNSNLKRIKNELELNIYPTNKSVFKIIYEDVKLKNIHNQNNQFLDASYSYKFLHNKSLVSISWRNILNNNIFTNSFISDNYQVNTNFIMRPSQILLKYTFRF